jgi:hypothetical protein
MRQYNKNLCFQLISSFRYSLLFANYQLFVDLSLRSLQRRTNQRANNSQSGLPTKLKMKNHKIQTENEQRLKLF